MAKKKVQEGCAYWCALNYDRKLWNPRKGKQKSAFHLGIIIRVFEGEKYDSYLVAAVCATVENLDLEDVEYTKIYYKNVESVVKHHELHSLSESRVKKFAFKLGENQFETLKKRVTEWILKEDEK
jgi:hypothetical protein